MIQEKYQMTSFVEPISRKVISWKKDVNYNIIQEATFSQDFSKTWT